MKKIFSILALSLTTIVGAQSFSFQLSDSVTEVVEGDDAMTVLVQNYVVNETGATIDNLKWKLEEVTLPDGWALYSFCDNNICYYITEQNMDTFYNDVPFVPLGRNDVSDFKIEVTIPENAPDNFGVVKAKVFIYTDDTETEIAEEQTATFIVNKGNVGVEIIDLKDERVGVYPNPGNEELFLYTDVSLNAQNFQVFDMIGRIVLTGNISDETTSINASSLQRGHYLIKVIDNNNNSITTRKWMKK